MKKPIIGITMGDPAGNGSEISVKALSRSEIYEQCRPVIIGDAACMEKGSKNRRKRRTNKDSCD